MINFHFVKNLKNLLKNIIVFFIFFFDVIIDNTNLTINIAI